jgi:hypothetical protein
LIKKEIKMKDYKKIVILLILFFAIAGLTMSAVSAASKTTGKIYFKDGKDVEKSVGNKEFLGVYYSTKPAGQQSGNYMQISIYRKDYKAAKAKVVRATVEFRKKVNGKIKKDTKVLKADKSYFDIIAYTPKNGYKPYSAKITYKTK